MVRTTALAVLAALAVLGLAVPALAKDSCSKDWLKYMVLNACGMDKRHLQRSKPIASQNMDQLINEVLEEADRMERGDAGDAAEGGAQPPGKPAPWSKDGDGNKAPAGLWKRLIEHPVELLRTAEEWIGLRGRAGEDVGNKNPRRRAIQNMITRCCSEECTSDDFEGIC